MPELPLELLDASLGDLHPLVAAAMQLHHISGRPVKCDPGLADTASFCAAYGIAQNDSANTLVVIGKAADAAPLAACLVLATTRLDVNGTAKRLLGTRKASFAPQEMACEVTGMEYGGVTAIGLPEGMPLWIDAAVLERSEIVVGGGNRSSKVLLNPVELLKLPLAISVENLAKPPTLEP